MLQITKSIKNYMQHEEDIQEIIAFEMENNWEYEIILDNLIDAGCLAKLMDTCKRKCPKKMVIETRYEGSKPKLNIFFENKETK